VPSSPLEERRDARGIDKGRIQPGAELSKNPVIPTGHLAKRVLEHKASLTRTRAVSPNGRCCGENNGISSGGGRGTDRRGNDDEEGKTTKNS